jgi:hypothetical protein
VGKPSHPRQWLLQDLGDRAARHLGPHAQPASHDPRHPWWKVMCLTGVDYFSTLGYQPGIAVLAAGVLSPVATLVLVLVTLAGALPVYRRVAEQSPHGEGSIAILERLLPFWKGKLLVLALLGFAATDFLITMTLSSADATAHLVENPLVPASLRDHRLVVTLLLLALLGAVFLRGFAEAIGIAVVLVAAYLALNLVVVLVALGQVTARPGAVSGWSQDLTASHGHPLLLVGAALLAFPKLALGLSGFETGVAVMPHVEGGPEDTEDRPLGRIRGTKKLLTTAALIMSVFLVWSSFVTTLLIPHREFEVGGQANGRALAYLAHRYLGSGFGTAYDLTTIAILWFAGASAMAGLLNLVPRYLPRYGMAPEWVGAVRPLVLLLTAVAFLVTWVFDADVDAQAGAYATGVLVVMTSAAVAVTIAARQAGQRGQAMAFGAIAAVFVYTTVANVVERPDGVKIGGCFIAAIVLVSLISRLVRSFELRVTRVELDDVAQGFISDLSPGKINLVANAPEARDEREYREKSQQVREDHNLLGEPLVFVEVTLTDPSVFETELVVHGESLYGYRVLTMTSSAVPNALAALLLAVRDRTGPPPRIYFEWTEGNPFTHFLRFLLFGSGEVAPVTREVLREAEPDCSRRPHVHVG